LPVWKLTIEYEGTRYRGWQEQKNARTIAGEVRSAAQGFLGAVEISGAGRTDAGVHAIEQVARLKAHKSIPDQDLLRLLNDNLPADINILKAEKAHPNFDPRRDARARYYIYQISTRRTAFAKRFVWWVKDRLDVESMVRAGASIRGRKDFRMFCEPREQDRSTMVDVLESAIIIDGDLILFRIGATHFLWKMVRRLVGTLVEVGRGNLRPADFPLLLAGRQVDCTAGTYSIAAHTAPPSGLFLERVVYDGKVAALSVNPAFPVRSCQDKSD